MIQILGLLGMYFDAVVVEVKKNLLLFRLAVTILCCAASFVQIFSKSDEFFAVSEGNHGTNSKYLGTDVEF